MKLSIIIPVYNEEKTLSKIISKINDTSLGDYEREIIIIDDASTDKTSETINKLKKRYGYIKSFRHDKNQGKGAAIRTGIKNLHGDFVIIQDADLEYDPLDIPKLLAFRDVKKFDVVYGSRILNKNNKYSYYSYLLGNFVLNKVTNLLYGLNLTDMETCYKLIPAKIIKELRLVSNGFDIEPEITAKIALRGYKIGEMPINYIPRSKEEGKKIRWRDGLIALWTLLYFRLNHE